MRKGKETFFVLVAVAVMSVLLVSCGKGEETGGWSCEGNEMTVESMPENGETFISEGSASEESFPVKEEVAAVGKWDGARLIGHSFGLVDGCGYTGCLEAFQERYEAGIRTFEVDFSTTSDGKIVLRHDWGQELQEGIDLEHIPSVEEFKKVAIYGKYTPLTFTDLLQLMKDYPDIWIITDSKAVEREEVQVEFEEIVREANEMGMAEILDRFIVQIYNEDMYDTVNEIYAFPQYIFTLYMRWYGDVEDFEQICRWCVRHDVPNITMWNFRYNEQIRAIADRYGMDIFVHTENDSLAGANYLKSGVDGLYTDAITEEMIDSYSDIVKVIYFGGGNYNASDYVLEGISASGEDFSWTEGNRLCFYIPIEDDCSNLRVEIPIEGVYNNSQSYEIYQNGKKILSDTISESGSIVFNISAEKGFCKFEMRLPNAVSPYELTESEDRRQLAFLLRQAVIYRQD